MNATESRRYRVLMVDSERGWRGGQAQVDLLMKGLVAAGSSVGLAAPADGALFARAGAIGVERFPWEPTLRGVIALRTLLARGGYDLVHSHASRAHGAVSLARAGLRPKPCHVASRRVDFAVGRGPVAAWKYRRGVDAYIAISHGVRDVLVAGGVPAHKVRVVPSGIDLDKFARLRDPSYLRAEFAIRPGERIVGNVAALAPHKSHADFLHAAHLIALKRDDVRYFVVGEGELRSELERLAESLDLSRRVTFTGFRNDALEILSVFDCFAMSSYLEGLGTSIMDAQALGVPVVATRTGGIPEIVEDGATGLLVPPRDPDRLAAAILRILDDGALSARCIQRARERSRQYDYRRTVYNTLDVYRDLCENGIRPLERKRRR